MSQKLVDLKNRMRSVENIKQTTDTMATVSAAKLARARKKALSLQRYAEKLREMALLQTQFNLDTSLSPLLIKKRKVDKIAMFVVASDIGMCGSFNGRICKRAHIFLDDLKEKSIEGSVWVKGIRGEKYFKKKTNYPILKVDSWVEGGGVSMDDALEVIDNMSRLFFNEGYAEIYCAYTKFLGPAKREPTVIKMLPLTLDIPVEERPKEWERWIYEPDIQSIMVELIPNYFKIQVFDVLLESYASEQGARMMAMEEASERAEKKLRIMLREYNKIRKDLITLDLLGILSAANVIEKEAASQSGF
ncbi:MAG: F0F1 ATP synthase subunit gamma [bacterium]